MLKPKTYLTTFLVCGLLFSQMASSHTKYEVKEIENGGYMLFNTVTGDLNVCERQQDGYRCKNFVPLSDEAIETTNTPSDWHSAFATTFQSVISKARSGLLFLLAEENFISVANMSKEAFKRLFTYTDQLKARS